MAKGRFSKLELSIWREIYGAIRGPSSGRTRIIVEDFEQLGLVPSMMRVKSEMRPYKHDEFQQLIQEAYSRRVHDEVQVYYHPAECARVVGSTTSTWTQWSRLILDVEGLVPEDAPDTHPILMENLPYVQLHPESHERLFTNGVRSRGRTRLLSSRMVVFFIAAQWEAWSTPHEVVAVNKYKDVLYRMGFHPRHAEVRATDLSDVGVTPAQAVIPDDVQETIEAAKREASRLKLAIPDDVQETIDKMATLRESATMPVSRISVPDPSDLDAWRDKILNSMQADFAHIDENLKPTVGLADDLPRDVTALLNEMLGEPMPPADLHPKDLCLDSVDDIDREIADAEAKLVALRLRKEQARLESTRKAYMDAKVVDATLDDGGGLTSLVLELQGGKRLAYTTRQVPYIGTRQRHD